MKKNIRFEMNYLLKQIEQIKNEVVNGDDHFDYERFGDLASVYDDQFGSSIYLGGYVVDKCLSITWSKHYAEDEWENLYCNLVDWEEINSVGKMKKYMIKMLKYYNNLYANRKEVK